MKETEILRFFERFEEIRGLSSVAYIQNTVKDGREFRQIKLKEVHPSESGIMVEISPSAVDFLNKKMKGKTPLLAVSFMKYYHEERDVHIYFPLVSVKLESGEIEGMNAAAREGKNFNFYVPWEREVVYDKHIIDFFFPGLKTVDVNQDYIDFVPKKIEEFFPREVRDSSVNMINHWIGYFRKHQDERFELFYPEPKSERSAAMMFFGMGEAEFSLKDEFREIAKNPSPLLTEYLSKEVNENKEKGIGEDPIWFGSLTKLFPLSRGQAKVLALNQREETIIPVMGCPGTGKSTLFLSLVANEITKRAINLAYGRKDYNNLMLLTSTANKAVEGVYQSLRTKPFHHGFVYVGGNHDNVIRSNKEVATYKEWLENQTWDPQKHKKLEKAVKNIHSYMERYQKAFFELKEHAGMFAQFKDEKSLRYLAELSVENEETAMDYLKAKRDVERVGQIVGRQFDSLSSVEEFFTKTLLMEMEAVKEDLSKIGFMKRLFSGKEVYKNLPFTPSSKEEFEFVYETVHKILKNKESLQKGAVTYEMLLRKEEAKKILAIMEKHGIKDSMLKRIGKGSDFLDAFRLGLYSLNYKLNLQAKKLLESETIRRKDDVLRAIEFFKATNKFQFLRDNYGFEERNIERFLTDLSLAFPVYASALASVRWLFPKFVKRPFNLVLADEAGMITVHGIVPALQRAKRAVIVGDPKQLPPIIDVADPFIDTLAKECSNEFWKQFSPVSVSAFHRAAGTKDGDFESRGDAIILDEHRRCAPKIAELFLKVGNYEGVLIKSRQPHTKAFQNIGENLIFWNVPKRDGYQTRNESEANAVVLSVKRLLTAGYRSGDIGVITPYREQERLLSKMLNPFGIKVGTVHKFQGAEMRAIVFSSVIGEKDSPSFVNDPAMLNVAISRAKEVFIMVGDFGALSKLHGPIKKVCSHIKTKGKLVSLS